MSISESVLQASILALYSLPRSFTFSGERRHVASLLKNEKSRVSQRKLGFFFFFFSGVRSLAVQIVHFFVFSEASSVAVDLFAVPSSQASAPPQEPAKSLFCERPLASIQVPFETLKSSTPLIQVYQTTRASFFVRS